MGSFFCSLVRVPLAVFRSGGEATVGWLGGSDLHRKLYGSAPYNKL